MWYLSFVQSVIATGIPFYSSPSFYVMCLMVPSEHSHLFWKVVGAAFAGTLVIGLPILYVFSGGKTESAVDTTQFEPGGSQKDRVGPGAPGHDSRHEAAVMPTRPPGVDPWKAKPAPPVRDPKALAMLSEKRGIFEFSLPKQTWSAAYDQSTGNLVLTNDDLGFSIYNIDQLTAGNLNPVAELPSRGLPLAACFKQTQNGGVFVVSGDGSPALDCFDSTTFEKVGRIELPKTAYADYLACSANPEDPFVYYSTDNLKTTVGRGHYSVGRANIALMQFESQANRLRYLVADFVLSADGGVLSARTPQGGNFFTRYVARGTEAELHQIAYQEAHPYVAHTDRQAVCAGSKILSPSFTHVLGSVLPERSKTEDYQTEPSAFFRDRPVCFGISATVERLFFASSNNWKVIQEIPLSKGIYKKGRRSSDDIRFRMNVTSDMSSPMLWAHADDARGLAMMVLSDRLIVAPLKSLKLPDEPSLVIQSELPTEVKVGEPIEISLTTSPSNATVFFLPGRMPVKRYFSATLGSPQPKKKSGLKLQAMVTSGQDGIFVSDVSPAKQRELPFRIKIDNEVMLVTGVDDFKDRLQLQRTDPSQHSVVATIEFLDGDDEALPAMPEVVNGVLKWTASPELVGPQVALFEIQSGTFHRKWAWEFTVVP